MFKSGLIFIYSSDSVGNKLISSFVVWKLELKIKRSDSTLIKSALISIYKFFEILAKISNSGKPSFYKSNKAIWDTE